MSALDVLKKLPEAFQADAAGDTRCTVQFSGDVSAYVTIADGRCTVTVGTTPDADVILTMDDEDLVALLRGELNGMTAFMTGKLQLDGDMLMAQRFMGFFDPVKPA